MTFETTDVGTARNQIPRATRKRRLSVPSLGLHASERKLLLWTMDMLLINNSLIRRY